MLNRRPRRLPPLPRTRRLAAGVLVLAALPIAGCGGSSGNGTGDGTADPAAVVPARSAFYGEVTVRPGGAVKADADALARKITKASDPSAKLVALIDSVLRSSGQSYATDVKPWLGTKIGVAITGLADPRHPDYAIIADATNPDRALAALEKRAPKDLAGRTYKGVGYRYSSSQQVAALAVKGTLAVGSEGAVKSIIDVEQGAASLGDSDKLKRARTGVSTPRLGFFYVDPLAVVGLLANATPTVGALAGPLTSLLGGAKGTAIGAALTTSADAIRLQTAAGGRAGSGSGETAASLAALPGGALLGVGLGNVAPAATKLVAQLGQLGGVYSSLLGEFKLLTGLDLQQDVIAWMGRGGLFVRATSPRDIGGALVIDTSDARKTATFIATARSLLTRFGGSVGRITPFATAGARGFQIAGNGLPSPVIVASGAGKFVVAIGASAVAAAVAVKPRGTLDASAQFKATAAQLGTPPDLYVDLPSLLGVLDRVAGRLPGYQAVKSYLRAFSGLAAGSVRSGSTARPTVVVGVR